MDFSLKGKTAVLVGGSKGLGFGMATGLAEAGVTEDKIPEMAADAMKSGNILVNPRQSTLKDIEMLYHKAM